MDAVQFSDHAVAILKQIHNKSSQNRLYFLGCLAVPGRSQVKTSLHMDLYFKWRMHLPSRTVLGFLKRSRYAFPMLVVL